MKTAGSKAEQGLQRFAFENPDEVLRWGEHGARQAALVEIFYKKGWRWIDGSPQKMDHPRQGGVLKTAKSNAKRQWPDPLKTRGEDTLEGFLRNNLAAKSFMVALVQTLAMARRPQKEAEDIVRRAAEKMYPDYVKRVRELSRIAAEAAMRGGSVENVALPKPADECLLANMPEIIEPGWACLAMEALALPRRIHDQFGIKTLMEVRDAKKWTDKMLRALKKKGLVAA